MFILLKQECQSVFICKVVLKKTREFISISFEHFQYQVKMSFISHWGEISKGNENLEVAADVAEDIHRSMNMFCLAEFDSQDELPNKIEYIRFPPIDPLMMYGISLHKYANHMNKLIRLAELAKEMNVMPSEEDTVPPIPKMPIIELKHKPNCLNFVPKEFTPFSMGNEVQVPNLSELVLKQIISKCVATMFAHIGFESMHQSLMDILVDVLQDFFMKICLHFKNAVENDEQHGTSGFPHVIERVLVETGLGGIRGLHDYYQCRVIKYASVLLNRSKKLNDYYETLLIIDNPASITEANKSTKIKKEEDIDENPEVHLIDGEVVFPTLETGFQLLNSLEAEASQHVYTEPEEEMNIPSSPSTIASMTLEAELSPFSKKKKYS